MPLQAPLLHQLLLHRSQWVSTRLMEGAARNGYGEVTEAMGRMFAHLAMGRPVGLSELARRLAVSRQAVHQLANEAAALGFLEFVPSESDGRVKLLRFTQKGWAMSDSAVRELQAIEAELATWIGVEDLTTLKRILARTWSSDEEGSGAP